MAWRALMTAKSGKRLQPQLSLCQAYLWGCVTSDVQSDSACQRPGYEA